MAIHSRAPGQRRSPTDTKRPDVGLTVGDVARLAGVTVRTLHHYDQTGLLRPSGRTDSGYRLYTRDDLERLQLIRFYRELDFALPDIARMLRDPAFGRLEALRAQRELLLARAKHTRALVRAIDAAIAAAQEQRTMTNEEMFGALGGFDPAEHEAEARDRWGESDAYRESTRRAKGYTKADWETIQAEGAKIEQGLAALLAAGTPASDPEAMALAERHRLQIDRWFYPCSQAMHVALGEMYVADPRFAARYESIAPGLARYVADAFRANAERAGG
jgi:DNA-binding transcriptional MerR regulator